MKTCTRCLRDLPPWRFSPHPRARDGLQSSCRECAKLAKRDERRHLKSKCKHHAGAMGHRFDEDDLRCNNLSCDTTWHQHQQKPEKCSGIGWGERVNGV